MRKTGAATFAAERRFVRTTSQGLTDVVGAANEGHDEGVDRSEPLGRPVRYRGVRGTLTVKGGARFKWRIHSSRFGSFQANKVVAFNW